MKYPDEEEVSLAAVISALANPHRRRAVEHLALQPATIQQLAVQLGLSLTAIDRHLTVLEGAGLIQRRKKGRVNFLALRRPALRQLQDWLNSFHLYWGSDDDTLENYIAAFERSHSTRTADDEDRT